MKITNRISLTIVAVVFLVSVLFFVFIIGIRKADPVAREAESLRSRMMPKASLQEIETHTDYSDEIMKGEVLLIYGISSCEACKAEMQMFSQLSPNSESKTKVFGVMFEDEQVVKRYIKQNNLTIPILIDKDGKLLKDLGINYFPANLKLNDGQIKKALFGLPKDQSALLALVEFQ